MRLFVAFLIFLLGVLLTMIAIGIAYYAISPSNDEILKQITFEKIETSFGNGIPADTLWPNSLTPPEKAILAKLENVRTFLALAEWVRDSSSLTDPSLPMYFTLPEAATSVRTFIAEQDNIPYTGDANNLVGVLLSPTQVAFKFAHDEVIVGDYFTGNDTTGSLQVLAVIIVYAI